MIQYDLHVRAWRFYRGLKRAILAVKILLVIFVGGVSIIAAICHEFERTARHRKH